MSEYTISQVYPTDKTVLAQIDTLLGQEGIRRDGNLDYICAMFDEEYNVIGTGSCFGNTLRCFAVSSAHQGEGLLNQITTVFTSRDVNIESLTTSESALAGIHKFTIVVRTGPERVDKLVRQIEKKIDVLKTFVYTSDEVVQQEIALYKVTRSRSVERLVRQHNVRILEIDDDYIVVEKTGHKAETKELFRLLQPYGVQQFVRSGIVAIIKSRRELLNEYLEELERSRRQTNSNHF